MTKENTMMEFVLSEKICVSLEVPIGTKFSQAGLSYHGDGTEAKKYLEDAYSQYRAKSAFNGFWTMFHPYMYIMNGWTFWEEILIKVEQWPTKEQSIRMTQFLRSVHNRLLSKYLGQSEPDNLTALIGDNWLGIMTGQEDIPKKLSEST